MPISVIVLFEFQWNRTHSRDCRRTRQLALQPLEFPRGRRLSGLGGSRGSRGELDGGRDLDDFPAVIVHGNLERLGAEQRGSFNEGDGSFVGGVEAKRAREKLVAAPEFVALGVHRVGLEGRAFPRDYGELGDDVFDLGVEKGAEQYRGPAHTIVERNARRIDQ